MDRLQHFSWWLYIAVATFYTGLEFGSRFARKGIFSKWNSKSRAAIVVVHAAFLTILLALMGLAAFAFTFLPDWLTYTYAMRRGDWSILDFLYIVAIFVMHNVEQKLIYAESDVDPHDTARNNTSTL